ncbi:MULTISPECIES: TRAP transporter small permease [Planococcus]|uniref:TRAP transporter small permease subunit n=1 Tax=Planococcus wigleyi TaxID=2762216 RepID=A0ABR8WD91_9BACL|nr:MULTISPECIES: TRAP transporter small permease subunit [Planococcus]MBD8014999.1 TRAP transporter small permease subunit [Planococcus wigleyi]MBF6633741.1 TRAP transporter small permease subunit [Planococcus sp. (in: firmicutes)]MDN3439061.1 TRAP transporter small permease subunit [Planococcus sp. APC 3900]
MTNFRKLIDATLAFLTVLSFAGVIIIVTIQIISRFAPFSFIWTEELTRYLFLYGIAFGAPLALMRNEFINVDMILNRMPDNFRRYYEIIIYLAIILLSLVMVVQGYSFTLLGDNQRSATMPFQMSVVHASLLIMSVFLVFYAVLKIIDLIKNKQDYSQNFGEDDF